MLSVFFLHEVRIAEFDDAATRRFLRRWLGRHYGEDRVRREVEQLMASLRDSAPLHRIAQSPLMLTIIAALHDADPGVGGSLSSSRAEFYDTAVRHLLRRDLTSAGRARSPSTRPATSTWPCERSPSRHRARSARAPIAELYLENPQRWRETVKLWCGGANRNPPSWFGRSSPGPVLDDRAHDGFVGAVDDLAAVGTVSVAAALVPLLWQPNRDTAGRAAWRLAEFLGQNPEAEEELKAIDLTSTMKNGCGNRSLPTTWQAE